MRWLRLILIPILIAATAFVAVDVRGADASVSSSLRRYPYLTDLVTSDVTVNWATTDVDRDRHGHLRWGRRRRAARRTGRPRRRTSITVGSTAEYQWKARSAASRRDASLLLPVFGGCDRPAGDGPDSPRSTADRRPAPTTPFSFAVFGDWGCRTAAGTTPIRPT